MRGLVIPRLAMAYAKAYWKRSLATMGVLAISIVSFGVFEGYLHKVREINYQFFSQRLMLGTFLVEPLEGGDSIDLSDQEWLNQELKKIPQIKVFSKFVKISGTLRSGQDQLSVEGLGVEEDQAIQIRSPAWTNNTLAGHPLRTQYQNQILMGRRLAKHLGCQVDQVNTQIVGPLGGYNKTTEPLPCLDTQVEIQVITQSGQVNIHNLQIAGLVDAGFIPADQRYILMNLKQAQKLMNSSDVSYYSVLTHETFSRAQVDFLITKLNQMKGDRNFQVRHWEQTQMGDLYLRTDEFLFIFRVFTYLLLLFIICLSVFINFTKVIYERRHNLHLLTLLGYRKYDLIALMNIEALYLLFYGLLSGLFCLFWIGALINKLGIRYNGGLISEPIPLWISFRPESLIVIAYVITVTTLATTTFVSSKQTQDQLS